MKKLILLCISFLFTGTILNAQITLSQANMPFIGLTAVENVDTVLAGISQGSAGANQTWDFTALATHSKDTTSFVNPSTLTGYSSFPGSNLGASSSVGQNFFLDANSSFFDILGLYGTIPPAGLVTVALTPFKRMITFPANYSDNYVGSYSYLVQIPFNNPPMDSARVTSSVSYSNLIDAWGTINTPAFSNVSCLRQKVREISTTSFEVHIPVLGWQPYGSPTIDTTDTYSWWSDSHFYTLAEIETDGSGVVTSAKYLQAEYTDIKQVSDKEIDTEIFPNPATDFVNIHAIKTDSYVVIFGVDGKLISSQFIQKESSVINTTEFPSGIYYFNRLSLDGSVLEKGKFEILK